jgi:hypothetical protein
LPAEPSALVLAYDLLQKRRCEVGPIARTCSEGHSQRAIAEIIGKEYPAFAGVTQPSIKAWLDKFTADAENLSPPDSRQHFDVWQFTTADQDAGIRSLSTTSRSAGLPSAY